MTLSRRDFFKITALGGMAVVGADRASAKTLYSYVIPPDNSVPGLATWYASVCLECPAGCGVRVRTREGRAVMVEGNPDHPVNHGGLCPRGHAALQGLYNPDRLTTPLRLQTGGSLQAINWDEAMTVFAVGVQQARESGRRVAFLGPLLGSLGFLVDRWINALGGGLRVVDRLPFERALPDGYRLAFGQDVVPRFRLDQARMILAVGADFLETWWSPVELIRGLAEMRRRHPADGGFVYLGPRRSLTAANADRFLRIRPGAEPWLLLGLLHQVLAQLPPEQPSPAERLSLEQLLCGLSLETLAGRTGLAATMLRGLAEKLLEQSPTVVLAGGSASDGPDSTGTAALGAVLNRVLGSVGQTVELYRPELEPRTDLGELVSAMDRGEITLLVIQEANPVFTTPAGLNFAQALRRVPLVVNLTSFPDETAALAHLTLPVLSPLERWGDQPIAGRGWGLAQPVMQPVREGPRAPVDILLELWKRLGDTVAEKPPAQSTADYLKAHWMERLGITGDAEVMHAWARALQQGGIFQEQPSLDLPLAPTVAEIRPDPAGQPRGLTLVAYPSPSLYDGRGANRPWLQELPDPMTKAVWGEWVEIHPDTARTAGVREGERIRLRSARGEIELPVIFTRGTHPDVVAVPLGQGHSAFGRYANIPGANPLTLIDHASDRRTGATCWARMSVEIRGTGVFDPPVISAGTMDQHGRGIARAVAPGEPARSPVEIRALQSLRTLNVPHEHPEHRWGMVIDLDLCVGCNACVTACSAENNVPVVGRAEMARNHAMHWIRIERYDEGTDDELETRFLPMLCQHCDQAPCETVCPVYATYHTAQGLNAMVYNRCIGTRYCENNCPYSVRSFNWFEARWPWPLNLQLNPDVTVRSVGVTEKCTFCVQRIREAEENARLAGGPLRDGKVMPACVSACPAEALIFGDLKDSHSTASRAASTERAYHALEHLNTKPAITYLARIRREERRKA